MSFGSGFRSSFILILIYTTALFPLYASERDAEKEGEDMEKEEFLAEVIDLYAGIPIIDAGKNRGLRVGDEFAVFEDADKESAGNASAKTAALVVVTRTGPGVSETAVRYGKDRIKRGTRLRRIRKLGIETSVYVRYTQSALENATMEDETPSKGLINLGVRAAVNRGFYSIRPVIGLEFPRWVHPSPQSEAFRLRFYGGGELLWHFQRLRVIPSAAVGIGAHVSEGAEAYVPISSYGGACGIAVSFLLLRDLHLNLELGGAAWKSIHDKVADEIGLFAGFGIGIRG
ncbi:MAG: hypothetical protein ACLFSA_04350 [Spirochaetaceae bacterium]